MAIVEMNQQLKLLNLDFPILAFSTNFGLLKVYISGILKITHSVASDFFYFSEAKRGRSIVDQAKRLWIFFFKSWLFLGKILGLRLVYDRTFGSVR